jgi:segregation and condensation protein A
LAGPPDSTGSTSTLGSVAIGSGLSELELDLDVFAGPFDLLLTIVLREELDLLEVELGEIVSAYVGTLSESGEIDLEATTEFLLLIASLLELKSRLMLPQADPELEAMEPEEAVEELVARMLEYRRYKEASAALVEMFERSQPYLYRSAPLPPELRRVAVEAAGKAYEPELLASAVGDLLTPPEEIEMPRIPVAISLRRRVAVLRAALTARASLDFDQSFGRESREIQAVTLLALLQLHGEGSASWRQDEICGPITIIAGSEAPVGSG